MGKVDPVVVVVVGWVRWGEGVRANEASPAAAVCCRSGRVDAAAAAAVADDDDDRADAGAAVSDETAAAHDNRADVDVAAAAAAAAAAAVAAVAAIAAVLYVSRTWQREGRTREVVKRPHGSVETAVAAAVMNSGAEPGTAAGAGS